MERNQNINFFLLIRLKVQNAKTPLSVFLFIGVLSVFYAEVNSGSSPLWFANLWGLLLVFWLYFAHLLFYVNIALRKNRISLSQLYLLGCLVGLYEGPITKVLWHGYPGQTATYFFLGFAVLEFIMLVFFWHPIFSFLLPVVIFELLSVEYLQTNSLYSWLEDSIFFTRPRLSKFIFVVIAFIGATFLSVNTLFNIEIILLSGLGNFILLILLKKYNLRSNRLHGIQSLYLSNKWFTIVFIYLVLLYSFAFMFLEAIYIPQMYTLVLTAVIYLVILGMFFISPKKVKHESFKTVPTNYSQLIQYSWIIWLIFLLIFPFIAKIASTELILLYLLLLVFGLILFINRLFWVLSLQLTNNKRVNQQL